MQTITSAKTSINRVCKVYRRYYFPDSSRILDFGGGKYDTNTEYMKRKHCKVFVYDPYNRTEEHNKMVFEECDKMHPDYIVCSNVLNVLQELDEVLDKISELAKKYKVKKVVFSVYEGDKSGKGKITTKGYQRNERTEYYVWHISRRFKHISLLKNKLIVCH